MKPMTGPQRQPRNNDMSISPTLGEAARVWARIGILSFGGPAAQIALMHREVVDERNWLSEKQFQVCIVFSH